MMAFVTTLQPAPFRRMPLVCRRSGSARGRAEKRGALYDAMSNYAAHFFPALDAEVSAEQNSATQPTERSAVLNQHGRLYSAMVYSLYPPRRLRQSELVAVSDGSRTALATALPDARLAAPVGSSAAEALSTLADSGAPVSVGPAVNSVPYERATAAVDAISKPRPSAGEITKLIVASLKDLTDINIRSLRNFRIEQGGPWFELARETVVSIKQEQLNRVIKKLPLNASQRDAVRRGLRARMTLIQGPPGTGKTRTAAYLIASCVSLRTGPVLACASSNVATDNLLRHIRKAAPHGSIVRLGRISTVAEDQWNLCLDCLLEKNREVRQARDALQRGEIPVGELVKLEQRVAQAILRKADIVVSTCVSCGRDELKGLDFPLVVVDEATQATEPNVLIALTATEKMARQVILVGDHHQLPPTVLSEGVGERLKISLFLRLWSCRVGCKFLQLQYRMHPQISSFPAKYFYFNSLRNGVSEEERMLQLPPASLSAIGITDTRTLFFDVPLGKEANGSPGENATRRGFSFYNRYEAEVVVTIVQALLGVHNEIKSVMPKSSLDVGIISPYAAQVRLLQHDIWKIDEAIEVASVDAFQGREKNIIIFSTVRSNSRSEIGFLRDWRRLNVALTRARCLLIVVGHRNTISADHHWKAWLSHIQDQHGMRSSADLPRVYSPT